MCGTTLHILPSHGRRKLANLAIFSDIWRFSAINVEYQWVIMTRKHSESHTLVSQGANRGCKRADIARLGLQKRLYYQWLAI